MSNQLADIAIVGAGGLGKETALLIEQINKHTNTYNLIGFFDDAIKPGNTILSIPVLGGINDLNAYQKPLNIIIAIGDPGLKAQLDQRIKNKVLTYPVLTHPTAVMGQLKVGEGSIITAGCVLTVDITIGRHVLVNANSTIGHDVTVGDYSSIMPGAHISGRVNVGKKVFIGTGVSVLQHVSIHDDVVVGAGAVVVKSINAAETVVGIPARPIKK